MRRKLNPIGKDGKRKRLVVIKHLKVVHRKVNRFNRQTKEYYEDLWCFGRLFFYIHKLVHKEWKFGRRRQEKVDKRTGQIRPVGEKYKFEHEIPGNMTLMLAYEWIVGQPLFNFVCAGGDGVRLVQAAKRGAVRGCKVRAVPVVQHHNFCKESGQMEEIL